MASNYPTSLDSFNNPSGTDSLNSPSHSLQHSDINDAVEALEEKLGIGASPAGSATTGQVLTAQGGGTAIWATPALVHINTTSFSSVASQSLDNVFSATYDSYRILLTLSDFSADALVRLKLRVSGVDASTEYYTAMSGIRVDGTGFNQTDNNVTTGVFLCTGDGVINNMYGYTGDIINPFLATSTRFLGVSANSTSTAIIAGLSGSGLHYPSTSYDGFNLIASTGNISGSVSVFGYRKS